MADKTRGEIIELLKTDVKAFNTWRHENPEAEINLGRADFSGVNLHGVHLQRLDLSCAQFVGADLRDAWLFEATLSFCDFSDADLCGAGMDGVYLQDARFYGAKIDFSAKELATTKALESVRGLPHGLYADAVAAGYKPER